jgi:hypothetical protein
MTMSDNDLRTIGNVVTLVIGTTLLTLAFGWKIGIGIAALTYFHKQTEG